MKRRRMTPRIGAATSSEGSASRSELEQLASGRIEEQRSEAGARIATSQAVLTAELAKLASGRRATASRERLQAYPETIYEAECSRWPPAIS